MREIHLKDAWKLPGGTIAYAILAFTVLVITVAAAGLVWQALEDYRRMAAHEQMQVAHSVARGAEAIEAALAGLHDRVGAFVAENPPSLEAATQDGQDPDLLAARIAETFPEAVAFHLLGTGGKLLSGRLVEETPPRFHVIWKKVEEIDLPIFLSDRGVAVRVTGGTEGIRTSMPKGSMHFRTRPEDGKKYINLGRLLRFGDGKGAFILGVDARVLARIMKTHEYVEHSFVLLDVDERTDADDGVSKAISLGPETPLQRKSRSEFMAGDLAEAPFRNARLNEADVQRIDAAQRLAGTNWVLASLSHRKNFLDAAGRMQLEIFGIAFAYMVVLLALLWFHRREIKRRDGIEANMARAMSRAEDAAEAKAAFLANMSHELRSPLNAIMGFSELIKDQIFGEIKPEYREYAENIHESGAHLLELINDILDMSKVEAGRANLNERVTNVAKVVETCMRLVSVRAETKGLTLATDLLDPLPPLFADERKLRQILINLLTNAIKFTPRGGRVTTRVFLDARGDFLLEVADTGIGIAPEDLEKALEPFGQVASELVRTQQGTGLGLPLTHSFVQLHGGELEIDSTPGQGTRVCARFPASRVIPLDQNLVSIAG